MQILEVFDRTPPAPGETWQHHEGNNYLILPQDIHSFKPSNGERIHGPFVKYQSTQNAAIYLAEQDVFMDVLWNNNPVRTGDEFPLSEAYCRFEKVSA